jgi:hypothetical protein
MSRPVREARDNGNTIRSIEKVSATATLERLKDMTGQVVPGMHSLARLIGDVPRLAGRILPEGVRTLIAAKRQADPRTPRDDVILLHPAGIRLSKWTAAQVVRAPIVPAANNARTKAPSVVPIGEAAPRITAAGEIKACLLPGHPQLLRV